MLLRESWSAAIPEADELLFRRGFVRESRDDRDGDILVNLSGSIDDGEPPGDGLAAGRRRTAVSESTEESLLLEWALSASNFIDSDLRSSIEPEPKSCMLKIRYRLYGMDYGLIDVRRDVLPYGRQKACFTM